MKQYLTPVRIIAFLLILAKSISVGSGLADKSYSDLSVIMAILTLTILFYLLYFSLELGTRFFIWPLLSEPFFPAKSSHTPLALALSKEDGKDTTENDPKNEEESNPIDNPKVQAVINYAYETFQNILLPEELSLLILNIKDLILGQPYSDNVVDRKIPKLRSIDLYHFGWNLSRHLQISQNELAKFVKSQFSFPLRNSEVETIYKKMGQDNKCALPRVEPDQPLLPFPLAEKLGIVS